MPYIKQDHRLELNTLMRAPNTAGELNYEITKLINGYLQMYGLSYTNINSCIGALECAKIELYRRVAAPYEDQKIEENGDVYSEELRNI